MDSKARVLMVAGMFLFLLGLLTGLGVPMFTNPRMGLSSHLEGVLNGMFLVLLGLLWPNLRLGPKALNITFGLALYGTFANWFSTLLASIWGTSRSTPIAGAGHAGLDWQEAVVDFGLISLSVAMIALSVLVIIGLLKKR